MMFSFDGINDTLPLAAFTQLVIDITSNKTVDVGFFLASGTRLYVKQLNAADVSTEGAVYLSTFHGAQ